MILVLPRVAALSPGWKGYIAGGAFYWLVCLALSIALLGRRMPSVIGPSRAPRWLALVAFAPAAGPLFAAFIPNAHSAAAASLLAIAGVAVVNASVEELFWRGVFMHFFSDARRGLVWPAVWFTVWHFALARVPGVAYSGGVAALVGGSGLIGAIWAFVAWSSGTIRWTLPAHVLLNFLAFTGLAVENHWA